jgi:hypothetical protein
MTGTIKTISDGGRGGTQGTHVATLPDGRIKISVATKSGPPCKEVGFIYNHCAHCGRDEHEMDKCPKAKMGRQTFTGHEIERTKA